MNTRIYFVRHAEPDFSVHEDFIRPLTQKGCKASEELVELLTDKAITRAYSSPYIRAVDTIKPFTEKKGLEIIKIDDLREREVGGWVEDFLSFAKKQWEDFNYKQETGESLGEVQDRNIQVINNILTNNLGSNILIGTHGTALCTIINYYNPMFGYNEFLEIMDKMPYVLCFEYENYTLMQIEIIGA